MRPALRGRPSLISVRGGQNQALRFYRNLLVLRGRGPLVDTRGDRDAVRYEGNTYCGDSGCFLVIDGHKVYRSPTEWRAQTGRELLPNCMGPPAGIDLSLRPTRGDRPGTCWEVGTNADE